MNREARVLAVIAAGGALGATARYAVSRAVHASAGGFPVATFWINVSGALALGMLMVLVLERFPPRQYLRPFLGIGFLGAYTTFSTFAVETDLLVRDGHTPVAVVYVVLTLVAGLSAVWLGATVTRLLPGIRPRRARSAP